jgi:ATP-dependent 26S proteasome regulatory subunit
MLAVLLLLLLAINLRLEQAFGLLRIEFEFTIIACHREYPKIMNCNDLTILINANIGLIAIETYDETRALSLLASYFRKEGRPCWRWSVSEGKQPLGFGLINDGDDRCFKPEEILQHIKKQQTAGTYVLCDLHPYLEDPKIVRLLKDIALNQQAAKNQVVLVSYRLRLPPEVARYAAMVPMSLPSDEEAKSWTESQGSERIRADNTALQKLVNNLKGLPHQDVRRLARGAIVDDGAITDTDLPTLSRAKFALMNMDSVLHFDYSTVDLADVAGLKNLKRWLAERKAVVVGGANPQNLLEAPKGVLLFGVQGGGKSLAAKAIAGAWGLPLLRLDMAALFNKFVGETERNLRDVLALADTMSPCVLWMDEIEKGLAQEDSDNATSKRLLGTLLTWMAERKSKVFLVATSNDISILPPELLRKGRFDEIFFVGLPDAEARLAMFAIHMKKRGLVCADFDISSLVDISDGYTGAEIEQAVVSATYAAAARSEVVNLAHIRDAILNTQPLSVVMAEKMAELTSWAQARAVPAD